MNEIAGAMRHDFTVNELPVRAPIAPYVDADYYTREVEAVFKRSWLHIGRMDEIPNAGDYFTKELSFARTSVLVVRDRDGEVRAYHNACQHRGNKLEWEEHGNRRAFACNFHGWVFGLDGQIKMIPDEEEFGNLDKADCALKKIHVGTWQGFIFINLAEQPQETLENYLGPLKQGLQGYPFAQLGKACYAWQARVRANWKTVRDAFQEGYHVIAVHTRSIGPGLTEPDNPNFHLLAPPQDLGHHHAISTPSTSGGSMPPLMKVASKFGNGLTRYVRDDGPETNNAEWAPRWPQADAAAVATSGINVVRSKRWMMDIFHCFPNLNIHIHDTNTFLTWQFWPVAAEEMVFEARWYFPEPKNLAERFAQEQTKCTAVDVVSEDLSTTETTQTMLASGALKEMRLSRQELAILKANTLIDETIEEFYADKG